MSRRVLIAGGGVAGISAAVHAIEKGWQPILLERTAQLGGRARSLYAKDVGETIDNGQHVLAASYEETRYVLEKIGSLSKIHFQHPLSIHFLLNQRRHFHFSGWALPAPFHFLLPLLQKAPLSRMDRKYLFRWGKMLRKVNPMQLKRLTVSEWLEMAGKSEALEQVLWEPITLATLNTPIHKASAFLLYQVLTKAFLGSAKNSGLGIPLGWLGDIFSEPAKDFIEKNNGRIHFYTGIKKLIWQEENILAVETMKEERITAEQFILALPPKALAKVYAASQPHPNLVADKLLKFDYSPIITINLWLRRAIPDGFPKALIDSPMQWLFEMPKIAKSENIKGYTIVISAAQKELEYPDEELLKLVDREFQHFFGQRVFEDFGLKKYKIIREKRATFLQTPAAQKLRPDSQTGFKNLFLAGDWINTDLPATIESAALSGRMAVSYLAESIKN